MTNTQTTDAAAEIYERVGRDAKRAMILAGDWRDEGGIQRSPAEIDRLRLRITVLMCHEAEERALAAERAEIL